jgi:hypothetical protein
VAAVDQRRQQRAPHDARDDHACPTFRS